jgi:hypothetical protein
MKMNKMLAMGAFFVVGLFGCGSSDSAKVEQATLSSKAVDIASNPAVVPNSDVVELKIGDTITVPIVVEASEPFSGFQFSLGLDTSKIEIVSSSLTVGDGSFSGLYSDNLDYQLNQISNNSDLLRNYLLDNVRIGLNKTVFMAGITGEQFSGKTTLFAVTIKGITGGKTILNPKGSYLDGDRNSVELPAIKAIQVTVSEI